MSATPQPKNSLIKSFLALPPRQRIQISAALMAVSCAGLYITDKVEKAILENQDREGTADAMTITTRGSSTDRVRLVKADESESR